MLTQLTGTLPIDGSYWTLTFEVLFYAGVALVWFVLRPRRSLELPCLSWLACSLAGHLFLNIGRHHRLSVLFDIEYANLFVLGMMVYYVSQRRSTWLTIATLSGSILMALFPAPFNGVMSSRLGFTLLVSAFGGLILLASNARWKFLDLAPLVFLGEISYSLYLIHQIVGFVVIHRLIAAGWGANTAILIALSFVIGLAYCLRILVEKPAEHWIKDLATERGKKANVLASVCATGSL
jgi:peptidoglycan/LPS O-acetylase OafA/YrhL